jgi:hypothetical protein
LMTSPRIWKYSGFEAGGGGPWTGKNERNLWGQRPSWTAAPGDWLIYGLNDGGLGVRVPVVSRISSTLSRLTLGPTRPLIQYIPGVISPGV